MFPLGLRQGRLSSCICIPGPCPRQGRVEGAAASWHLFPTLHPDLGEPGSTAPAHRSASRMLRQRGCNLLNGKHKRNVLSYEKANRHLVLAGGPREGQMADQVKEHCSEVTLSSSRVGQSQRRAGSGQAEHKCWQHLHFQYQGNFACGELYTSYCAMFLELL